MYVKKKASKTWWHTGTAVVLGTGLLAGCGGASGNSQGEGNSSGGGNGSSVVDYSHASGQIVFAASPVGNGNQNIIPILVQQFEKSHPDIKVQLVNQSTDTDTNRASLTTQIGGGSATPDVYMGDVVWPAQFAASGLAEPLSKVLPSSFWNRFSNGLVSGATYKGQVYAAPFFVDSSFLYYRKDLLDKAHLPVPTSWEQVQQESEQLQKQGLVKYGFVWQGASYEGLTCDFMEFLTDAGGKVLDSSGKAALDSPEANKALTFMKGLVDSGVSPKSEVTFQEPQAEDAFLQGSAAFLRNWSYAWNDSQNPSTSKVVGKVGVTVLPTFGGGGGYSYVGGWDLYVNPHTKNMAAALAFIDWMTGTEGQKILSQLEIPTNASVASDPSVQSKNPIYALASKTHYVSRPVQSSNYPQISQAIYTNVNAVLAGSESVADALKKAQQQIAQVQSSGGGL
ncbi:ABC transporter substrate-binding protein [Alicyclobacillus contaminans]|uniref:ABC transporter substrate-binding protein n=1 Tax=Alicyclobacillus contaminans TaxID=392016 RepID=UPI000A01AB6C